MVWTSARGNKRRRGSGLRRAGFLLLTGGWFAQCFYRSQCRHTFLTHDPRDLAPLRDAAIDRHELSSLRVATIEIAGLDRGGPPLHEQRTIRIAPELITDRYRV